jgi:hypothetical protein
MRPNTLVMQYAPSRAVHVVSTPSSQKVGISLWCIFIHIVKHSGAHHASNMLSFTTTTSPECAAMVICNHLGKIVCRRTLSVQIEHMAMHRSVDDANSMAVVRCVDSIVIVFHIFIFDILVVGIVEGWVVPRVEEVGVMRRRRWRKRKVAESGAIAIVVRVINHAGFQARTASTVEVFAKALDAVAREDTEDFALVVVELGRGFAAKDCQIIAEEGLNACQTQVCQAWAVVEQCVDALEECQKRNLEIIKFGYVRQE